MEELPQGMKVIYMAANSVNIRIYNGMMEWLVLQPVINLTIIGQTHGMVNCERWALNELIAELAYQGMISQTSLHLLEPRRV